MGKNKGMTGKIKVLFIEDHLDYAMMILRRLLANQNPSFEVKHVSSLESGIQYLTQHPGEVNVCLLDLTLSDSRGLETFHRVRDSASDLPIVIMSGLDDERTNFESLQTGAQDYLVKGKLPARLIPQTLVHAIQRQRHQSTLSRLSMMDELTGLFNRRGFSHLLAQKMKVSIRTQKGFWFISADVDGLKQINDTWGHSEGDRALEGIAAVLKSTFRSSDILARMGGDEFMIAALESKPGDLPRIKDRLEQGFADYRGQASLPFTLSVSLGGAYFDPLNPCSPDELMTEVDRALYREKTGRKVISIARCGI